MCYFLIVKRPKWNYTLSWDFFFYYLSVRWPSSRSYRECLHFWYSKENIQTQGKEYMSNPSRSMTYMAVCVVGRLGRNLAEERACAGTVVWEMGSNTRGTWQKTLPSKPAPRLKGRVKNEAWQGKGTGRNVGKDKGCKLASHDSAPPSEDENSIEGKPGNRGDRIRRPWIAKDLLQFFGKGKSEI